MTIFRPVYVLGIRTHYFNAVAKELDGQIIRNLTTRGYHHAIWIFELDDIEHALKREFVEVEAIRHVVIGRDGLGIGIDHDRAATLCTQRFERLYARPVEFNGATDCIGSGAKNGNLIGSRGDIVLATAVGEIEIIGTNQRSEEHT